MVIASNKQATLQGRATSAQYILGFIIIIGKYSGSDHTVHHATAI